MTQTDPMQFIPSKKLAPCIHKLVKLSGSERLPKHFNDLLKRDAIAQWIPENGAAATQMAGLCYTSEAFRAAIHNFLAHLNVAVTDDHHQVIDQAVATAGLTDEVGNVVLIQNLADNDQVGMAMREVQGEKKMKPLSHPSLTDRAKLQAVKMVPVSAIEAARKKMAQMSQRLTNAMQQDRPLVGIDVEMFEHKHSTILEVGLATIHQGKLATRHLIIDEHRHHSNGKYVPDHRHSFHFGKSEVVSLEQASHEVATALTGASALFGHAVGNDIRILGIPSHIMNNVTVFDTQDIHKVFAKAVAGDKKAPSGLSTIAPQYLGDSALDLCYHNAGNDIEVTGRVLLKQANLAWVNSQYQDLSAHHEQFQSEQARVNKENLSRCIDMFKKHFKGACELTGTDVLDLAEDKPLQALDGFRLALDIKQRAEAVKMVHAGIPMLDYLRQLESLENGVSDMIEAIQESSVEYAKDYLKSQECMAEPSAHRQMIRIALESESYVETLNHEAFLTLKKATDQAPQREDDLEAAP